MTYVKTGLSLLASVFFTLVCASWWYMKGLSQGRATGLAAVAGGLTECLLSPAFWVVVIVSFGLLLAASRAQSNSLRMLLFWIPTISLTSVGFLVAGLFAYAYFHVRSY